jgi:SAM-dependent methyltransferase
MDPYRFTTLAHADRMILGPVSEPSLAAILDSITCAPPHGLRAQVVDVGCGKGAWLLAAMERFSATGTAIEPNPTFATMLRTYAMTRGLMRDLRIEMFPAAQVPLMPHSFDLGICVGSLHAFGGYRETLAALSNLVKPMGWGIVGEGFWRRTPDHEYLEFFGADESMMMTLDATLETARECGWQVAGHHVSTQEEFDDYEHTYAASLRRALQARPDDPDTEAFHARIEAHADAYARWGHDTFGFVTMVLRR